MVATVTSIAKCSVFFSTFNWFFGDNLYLSCLYEDTTSASKDAAGPIKKCTLLVLAREPRKEFVLQESSPYCKLYLRHLRVHLLQFWHDVNQNMVTTTGRLGPSTLKNNCIKFPFDVNIGKYFNVYFVELCVFGPGETTLWTNYLNFLSCVLKEVPNSLCQLGPHTIQHQNAV